MRHRPVSTMSARTRQRGAVLIVAMILLVVLTLLGVSAMNTTQLEERMAVSNQQSARAFQTAENGLSEAFNTGAAWDISGTYTDLVMQADSPDVDAVADGQSEVATNFLGFTPPPPGSLYSATSFQAAHFDFASGGCTSGAVLVDVNANGSILDECATAGGITVTVHGGGYQIAPRQN
ncbi:MAG: hypothetical protein H6983_14295 [Ectothiorhodospiraceae bacterium]|nr:hypothetical protein [Chromatiales bacterium]MCP5155336.1 hypothetical protein [Ectothiorhodospiraceae bacterium]